MINVDKQVIYWHDGAVEDWQVAQTLIDNHKIRHGLFFAHLTLEKLLKAHVCRWTRDLAPRTHNLSRLAELSNLPFQSDQLELLADMNGFNLQGRYPDSVSPIPSVAEAKIYLTRAEKVYEWLKAQLSIP